MNGNFEKAAFWQAVRSLKSYISHRHLICSFLTINLNKLEIVCQNKPWILVPPTDFIMHLANKVGVVVIRILTLMWG